MQSSATVAFRACVMLACLVAIPAAALFGTSLPGLVRTAMNGDIPFGEKEVDEPLSEAPPFQPGQAQGHRPGVTQAATELQAAAWPAADRTVTAPTPLSGDRGAVWADYQSRQQPGVVPAAAMQTAGDRAPPFSMPSASTLSLEALSQPGGPPPAGSALAPLQPVDRFSHLQQRLRQLGATYYLLETWGDRGQYYRFHCRMAVVPGGDFTRQFDATDSDPLRAMTRVLSEVEAWRQAGVGPAARAGIRP